MTGFQQDLASGLRSLRLHPGFALAAVAAAALGIGATTAIFSVVDRILFRPLPYQHQDRLVSTGMLTPLDTNEFLFAEPYLALRREAGGSPRTLPFESVTAFEAGPFEVDWNDENPFRLKAMRVERNFFETLGVALAAGRTFSEQEDRPNGPPVAIVSYALWTLRLGRALDQTVQLDGQRVAVIGVLPPGFEMPTLTPADILLPLALDASRERAGRALRVFARLPAGLDVAEARHRIAPFAAAQLATVPPRFRAEIRWAVRPVRERQVGSSQTAAYALLGAAMAILLIGCANIANLLLARAVEREREMVIRAAIGASRGRLVRQLLTESMLVGGLGGAAGCILAWGLLRLIVGLGPGALPRIEQASLDLRVLAAAAAMSLSPASCSDSRPRSARPLH